MMYKVFTLVVALSVIPVSQNPILLLMAMQPVKINSIV